MHRGADAQGGTRWGWEGVGNREGSVEETTFEPRRRSGLRGGTVLSGRKEMSVIPCCEVLLNKGMELRSAWERDEGTEHSWK